MRNLLKHADPLSYAKALTTQVLGEIRKEETAAAGNKASSSSTPSASKDKGEAMHFYQAITENPLFLSNIALVKTRCNCLLHYEQIFLGITAIVF